MRWTPGARSAAMTSSYAAGNRHAWSASSRLPVRWARSNASAMSASECLRSLIPTTMRPVGRSARHVSGTDTTDVLPENARMSQVFRDAGYAALCKHESGVLSYELSTEASDAVTAAIAEREHSAARHVVRPAG